MASADPIGRVVKRLPEIRVCNLGQRVGAVAHREAGDLGGAVFGDHHIELMAGRRDDGPGYERGLDP